MSTAQKSEALDLAYKYEVHGFLGDHRFAQNEWCRQAATELRRLHAANIICRAWHEEDQQEIASLQVRLEASQKSNADLATRIHALVEAANATLRAEMDELTEQMAAIGAGGVEPLRKPTAQAVHPENIREGAPYDNPEFEQLARDMGVWGTAQSAVCAQFWLAATQPAAQGVNMVNCKSGNWLTVVYRDIQPGHEARAIVEHPKASALSWSHALRDRDAALAAQAKQGE